MNVGYLHELAVRSHTHNEARQKISRQKASASSFPKGLQLEDGRASSTKKRGSFT